MEGSRGSQEWNTLAGRNPDDPAVFHDPGPMIDSAITEPKPSEYR